MLAVVNDILDPFLNRCRAPAYPHNILDWHEVVNDAQGSRSFVMSNAGFRQYPGSAILTIYCNLRRSMRSNCRYPMFLEPTDHEMCTDRDR
jgi:hypothetical protein